MDVFDKAELWDRATIEAEQLAALKRTISQAAKAPFYRNRFAESDISVDNLYCLDDIKRLPFTTKDDLRGQYPMGLLCVPRNEVVRMHSTSGTTGIPVAISYTRNDLHTWASLVARSMHSVGLRPGDVFQNMSGYGLFTGGLGIHAGAELLGCLTVPAGPGNSKRQVKIMRDFQTVGVHIIPSYALYLASTLLEEGEDPTALPIRIALVGAEPHTEETRRRIEKMFNLKAYNSYGLTEMNGPGVAFECEHQCGMHLWEDAYYGEIIDPETGENLPDGEIGELVLTTLRREGMPVLRYRTRDLTRFIPGPCPCGRAHRRIDRIVGRSDDMFIIKGVNIYPMQVEQVLMGFQEVGQNYLIVLETEGEMDTITVQVEVNDRCFQEDMRVLQRLQKDISNRLKHEILVTPKVQLVQQNSLPKSEGKAQRLSDLRKHSL